MLFSCTHYTSVSQQLARGHFLLGRQSLCFSTIPVQYGMVCFILFCGSPTDKRREPLHCTIETNTGFFRDIRYENKKFPKVLADIGPNGLFQNFKMATNWAKVCLFVQPSAIVQNCHIVSLGSFQYHVNTCNINPD